jgi:hypothetical protein
MGNWREEGASGVDRAEIVTWKAREAESERRECGRRVRCEYAHLGRKGIYTYYLSRHIVEGILVLPAEPCVNKQMATIAQRAA